MAFKCVAVVLLACIFGANARRMEFENCDSSAPIKIKEVNVNSAYPIKIKPGYTIAASGRYSNRYAEATSETVFRVNVKVEKKMFWSWRDVTRYVKDYIPKTIKCGDVQAKSPIALCPGPQGKQTFDENFTVPKTLNLGGIAGLFGSGKYRLMLDVRDNATGKRVVCVEDAYVEIKL